VRTSTLKKGRRYDSPVKMTCDKVRLATMTAFIANMHQSQKRLKEIELNTTNDSTTR
jgi:hypothetical protein